ncbi:hypothetical protein V8E53_005865 [Lactarius tabidus]
MTRSHVCCCSSLTVYEALAVPYTRPHLRAFTAKKAISSDLYASSSGPPTPNFQPIFEKALKEYKKKTGKDLRTTHPFSTEINVCESPYRTSRRSQRIGPEHRRATHQVAHTSVNALNALSATLGQGVGSVFPLTNIIFSRISILLVAAKNTAANREPLIELFNRIEAFFCRLKTHTEVPPTAAIIDVMAKIMAEVLRGAKFLPPLVPVVPVRVHVTGVSLEGVKL